MSDSIMQGLIIRCADLADARIISRLVTSESEQHIIGSFSQEGRQNLLTGMTEQAVRGYLNAGYRFYLGELGGVVVGVAALKPPAHLYYLFVRTESHQQGIGRRLWQHVLASVPASADAAPVSVNASLNAVPVYERLGFVRVAGIVTTNGVQYQPMEFRRTGLDQAADD